MINAGVQGYSTSPSPIYAALRIVAGLLFAQHGAQKFLSGFGGFGGEPGKTAELFTLIGLPGVIGLLGGLLIAIGLFAGFTAFIATGQMEVACFMAHFPRGFVPIQNGGELAVLYRFLFLYIASHGAGRTSARASSNRISVPSGDG